MARFDNTPPSRLKSNALATLVRIFVLAAVIVAAVQSSAFADKRDFTIVNHAGQAIHYVYCTAYSDPNWSVDVLGNKVIMPGGSQKLCFDSVKKSDRYWDVRIVFADGGDWYWRKIDLHTVWRMTVYKNGGKYYADWN